MPYDVSAERGIICTLVMYPQFYFSCANLKDSHFYDTQNGVLFWAIQELVGKGITRIDDRNLAVQIGSNSEKSRIVGKDIDDQLAELVDNSSLLARSSEQEYKQLVNRVVGLGFKRELYRQIKTIENRCLTDVTNDISQINSDIVEIMDGLAIKYITGNAISNFGDKVDRLWERLLENRNEDGTVGYSTGFPTLDKFLTYRKGELVVIEANRKMGKSVFGMNAVYHMLKCGLAVVYFDTEMNDDIFFSRLLSHMTGIPEDKILAGCYSSAEEVVLSKARAWLKTKQLVHEYDPSWTRDRVVTECKILKNQGRLDFFIYDYLKDTSGKSSTGDVYIELGGWCNDIKNKVCGALDIPGLTFAQLNRAGETGDSYKIEQYVTAGLKWRPKSNEEMQKDGQACGNYALQVMFNRIGGSHAEDEYIDFVFKKEILTVEEAKTQHTTKTPFD